MGLLNITPELTKIVNSRQLSKLGFKTCPSIDYWYKDIPCVFSEHLTSVDVRLMVAPKWVDSKIQGWTVRIQPINLRQFMDLSSTFILYNNSSQPIQKISRPVTINFSPTQMEIVYLEVLEAMMTEDWAKGWFVQNIRESRIDFEHSRLFKE